MFGEHLILHDAGVEFIAVSEVRPDILAAFYVVPIDIGIAEKNSDLMFSSPMTIDLPDGFIQGGIDRRYGAQRHGIPPSFLDFFDGHVLPGGVAIHGLLI